MKFIKYKLLASPFKRFLLVGAVNTLLTYLIYLIGLLAFNYIVAYSCSYMAGILISYLLNSRFVFHITICLSKAINFTLMYGFQYLLGVSLLYLLVDLCHVNKVIAPFLVIAGMMPITFLSNKCILQERKCT